MVLILVGRLLEALSALAPDVSARVALWLTRRTRRRSAVCSFGRQVARHRVGAGEVVLHARGDHGGGPRVLLVHG